MGDVPWRYYDISLVRTFFVEKVPEAAGTLWYNSHFLLVELWKFLTLCVKELPNFAIIYTHLSVY